jgi:putative copper export protein
VVVTFVALPFVLGRGRIADNPSRQPLDYGRGLLVVLAAIWSVVLVAVAVRYLLAVRRRPREEVS